MRFTATGYQNGIDIVAQTTKRIEEHYVRSGYESSIPKTPADFTFHELEY